MYDIEQIEQLVVRFVAGEAIQCGGALKFLTKNCILILVLNKFRKQQKLTVIAPFVDEALCPSFDELVSVEKPESWTTLPLLFSPLFGSFLPLCELLRLRVSDDEDNSPAATAAAVAPLAAGMDGSFCETLRFKRMPGSHSRLRKTNV